MTLEESMARHPAGKQRQTFVIRLPFLTPPLRSNHRLHWRALASEVAAIRSAGKACALWDMQVPLDGPVRVEFVWTVTDRRRRDAGSCAPTLKAALDGVVDAGRISGDHSDVVLSETCRIELGTVRGCRIEITPVTE